MRRVPRHIAALLGTLRTCGGITDAAALVEAQRDYLQIADLIRSDLRTALQLAGDQDPWPYVRALYDDAVVIEHGAKLWRYPYTVTDDGGKTTLKLGARTEVVTSFVPATVVEASSAAVFLEAEADGDKPARRFKVRVIKAGMSLNNNFYSDAVLKEAVGLFDGARVFAKSDADHLKSAGKDVRNLIGQLSEAVFVPGPAPDSGEIRAVMTLINPAADIAVTIREAVAGGMSGLFGLSIDAAAKVSRRKVDGVTITEAKKLLKIRSVDLIVDAGAGGAVLDLAEAAVTENEDDNVMTRAQLLKLIKARRPQLLAGKDEATLTEAELEGLVDQALTEAVPAAADSAAVVALIEARQSVRDRVNRCGLPEQARAKVAAALLARDDVATLTEAQIEDAIKAEQSYLTGLGLGGGQVLDLGPSARIEGGESRREKVATMLEAFFDPNHRDHRHAGSIRDIYLDITGDRRFTGRLKHCDEARLREALGSESFPDALGDTINRRMLADYKQQTALAGWRPLVNVTRVGDFRKQTRVRVGGYGAIPKVGERQPYLELPSPGDESAEYVVEKRGGLESASLEMIRNDDVGTIRQIPTKLSRAANRTLAKFVFDFFRDNPVIYDGLPLFHASRGNLGTAAIGKDSWDAARVGLITRTKSGEDDTVGVGPKFALVSPYQTRATEDLFVRTTNNDADFLQRTRPVVAEVWYWTDPNDWVAAADPLDVPGIEIGFLDGQEEPELFVQDAPNSGSMFFNDTLTWKLRHIYGGAVCDWRPFYKAVVP